MLQALFERFGNLNYIDLSVGEQSELKKALMNTQKQDVDSLESGERFILLVKMLREAIEENDKLHGENYLKLLNQFCP